MNSPNPIPRLAIFGSGQGHTMLAIQQAIQEKTLNAHIAFVLSDDPQAGILARAKNAGIETITIDCQGHSQKFPLEAQSTLADKLHTAQIDLICLAGFMRLIKSPLLKKFPNRILNIHPSLLPKFPGLKAWQQAVDAKATETGCTVHYTDAGMDTGEIILQAKVPIKPGETANRIYQKIRIQEQILYPQAIQKILNKHSKPTSFR